MAEYNDTFVSLREHKVYVAWNPNITFAYTAGLMAMRQVFSAETKSGEE